MRYFVSLLAKGRAAFREPCIEISRILGGKGALIYRGRIYDIWRIYMGDMGVVGNRHRDWLYTKVKMFPILREILPGRDSLTASVSAECTAAYGRPNLNAILLENVEMRHASDEAYLLAYVVSNAFIGDWLLIGMSLFDLAFLFRNPSRWAGGCGGGGDPDA